MPLFRWYLWFWWSLFSKRLTQALLSICDYYDLDSDVLRGNQVHTNNKKSEKIEIGKT